MARTAPLHASLVRPILVAGVEPRIVILEGTLVAALLLGVGLHTLTLLSAALIAFLLHPLLAQVSKRDPQALAIYVRATHYQPFYPRSVHPASPSAHHLPFDEVL